MILYKLYYLAYGITAILFANLKTGTIDILISFQQLAISCVVPAT